MGKLVGNRNSLVGLRFDKLMVTADVLREHGSYHRAKSVCLCDCGVVKNIRNDSLQSGAVISCGCEHKTRHIKMLTKHGCHNKRIYHIWEHMKGRCQRKTDTKYKYYGGRGIKVCEEWQEFIPFYKWAMQNGYADNLTIDRINNDGNYEPQNCRWLTMADNLRNMRHLKK